MKTIISKIAEPIKKLTTVVLKHANSRCPVLPSSSTSSVCNNVFTTSRRLNSYIWNVVFHLNLTLNSKSIACYLEKMFIT